MNTPAASVVFAELVRLSAARRPVTRVFACPRCGQVRPFRLVVVNRLHEAIYGCTACGMQLAER